MTPKERAILIWNASSQSKQDKKSFIAFVAEHIEAETEQLRSENEQLRAAMRDAMKNCEVCRWEDTKERRCARCQTFDMLLGEHAVLDAPA